MKIHMIQEQPTAKKRQKLFQRPLFTAFQAFKKHFTQNNGSV